MFAAVGWAFAFAPRKSRGPKGAVGADGSVKPRGGASGAAAKKGAKPGFMARVEARWDRRRGQGF
jgi:hypothetical protein